MIKLGKFFLETTDRYQYGGQQGHVFLLQWILTTILRAKNADQEIALQELHSYTNKDLSSPIFQSLWVRPSGIGNTWPDLHFVQYIKA